jgi:hypothetical protein
MASRGRLRARARGLIVAVGTAAALGCQWGVSDTTSCRQTIDAYCQKNQCERSWSDVCGGLAESFGGACDGYDWLSVHVSTDIDQVWYFDAESGQLAVIYQWGPDDNMFCAAGPGSFSSASSCPPNGASAERITCDAAPAGTDGGTH